MKNSFGRFQQAATLVAEVRKVHIGGLFTFGASLNADEYFPIGKMGSDLSLKLSYVVTPGKANTVQNTVRRGTCSSRGGWSRADRREKKKVVLNLLPFRSLVRGRKGN